MHGRAWRKCRHRSAWRRVNWLSIGICEGGSCRSTGGTITRAFVRSTCRGKCIHRRPYLKWSCLYIPTCPCIPYDHVGIKLHHVNMCCIRKFIHIAKLVDESASDKNMEPMLDPKMLPCDNTSAGTGRLVLLEVRCDPQCACLFLTTSRFRYLFFP